MAAKSSTPPNDLSEPSKSGITVDEHGVRHIPSSVRADGSVRKEIRIRPGYRPPEDVEVYKNRTAEAFRNRGKDGSVPGAEAVEDGDEKKPEAGAASNKNAKRREARKRAAAAKAATEDGEEANDGKELPKDVKKEEEEEEAKDAEVETDKELKKLLKKLRQARELKDKKDKGAALLPEQFEKVIRINELIRQIDALGFTTDGEKKQLDAT